MYIFLIATCFLLTFQVNARKIYIYERDASYNPCVSGSGVYFYPDPTDPHRYYQCDASGKFYLQTCASDLVWDDLITACNYASAVAPAAPAAGGAPSGSSSSGGGSPSPPDDSSETPSSGASSGSSSSGGGSQSPPDDSSETPSSGSSKPSSSGNLGPTQISFPSSPSDKPPATIQKPSSSASSSSASSSSVSSSSSSSSSSSLCKPVNPCGDHGECIESPSTSSSKRRRFACICEEDWFGRLCDKQSSGFSTPGPRTHLDQIINNTLTTDTFSLPISNEKDSKYIFYGLNGNNKVEPMSHLNKRMIEPVSDEEFD
ncbi:unnamed protein product [Adineta steineri]|uniref:Chitin-binding type-2 domain-containing protein n=1 Tax=Adineta steineri TaxID=433720 RepID=A0A815HGC0_9BILA|nr:unnamed protein product [Adineta steineri]CAF3621050.1 unnamed protein product [Adineta steineri]